ncbi:MAG: site-2 protease family protein [Erysipelotrichaceae bacterium]|nr:site-2 protease family protein [Erysipelotrichaceae bacterium]
MIVWFFLALLKATGWVFFCYGLMFFHEAAHALSGWFFGCDVLCVKVYPFGLCAHLEGIDNLSNLKKAFVYFSGPSVHLFVQILIVLFWKLDILSLVMRNYLTQLNLNYFIFNLLPIYPLDGYHLFLTFLQVKLSFYSSAIFMQLVSFIALFLFIRFNPAQNLVFVLCAVLLCGINVFHLFHLRDQWMNYQLKKSFSRFTAKT